MKAVLNHMRLTTLQQPATWWALTLVAFAALSSVVRAADEGAPAAKAETAEVERMEPLPKDLEGVGIDEQLGRQVRLDSIVNAQKPVVLTLNYSDCPMLCSLQLDGFVESLRGIAWTAGEQFDIVTVSIDPKETVERSRLFKDKYMAQYQREQAKQGWHFLTGTEQAIQTLAASVGFQYRFVEDRQEYAHTAALMVLSPDGMVTRYLYGIEIPPRDLRLALVEAAEGKVGSTVDRILLYCFHYDASVGRYTAFAGNIMRLGGFVTVIVLGSVLALLWLRDAKKQRIPLG